MRKKQIKGNSKTFNIFNYYLKMQRVHPEQCQNGFRQQAKTEQYNHVYGNYEFRGYVLGCSKVEIEFTN